MTPADISEAERIKTLIKATTTREALQAVVDAERAAVKALEARPGCAVFRIHIQNLVNYHLRWMHKS